jgi:hypothetical protein
MSLALMIAIAVVVGVIVLALGFYIFTRYFEARYDRTFMTHDERGFKRALKGKTVLWDWEESVVKGSTAPQIEFVALDPATGGRRTVKLLDARTGAINLRPHYCAPLPFEAVTADKHKVVVDARVQFKRVPLRDRQAQGRRAARAIAGRRNRRHRAIAQGRGRGR